MNSELGILRFGIWDCGLRKEKKRTEDRGQMYLNWECGKGKGGMSYFPHSAFQLPHSRNLLPLGLYLSISITTGFYKMQITFKINFDTLKVVKRNVCEFKVQFFS